MLVTKITTGMSAAALVGAGMVVVAAGSASAATPPNPIACATTHHSETYASGRCWKTGYGSTSRTQFRVHITCGNGLTFNSSWRNFTRTRVAGVSFYCNRTGDQLTFQYR